MARNLNKLSFGTGCRNIYNRYKALFETAKFPSSALEEALADNDYDSAISSFVMTLAIAMNTNKQLSRFVEMCGQNTLSDMFDTMWYYRRNLHFKLDSIPAIDITDTTILDEFGQDLCFDILVNDTWYAVFAFKRNFLIKTRAAQLNWTIQVYTHTADFLDEDIKFVTRAATSPVYTFHIEASDNTRRAFIEHASYNSYCKRACNECKKCAITSIPYNIAEVQMRLFPLKLRGEKDCLFETNYEMINPSNVLKCILHSLECYKAREVITRKNGKKAAAYQQCKVHIASDKSNADDKIVMLPLHEYVKEYRESHKHEYKGGHHASPVAHTRRGYYRKSRKHGDYIKQGDQFIYVGNKQGDYSFVRATHVNSKNDRVIVYQTTQQQH